MALRPFDPHSDFTAIGEFLTGLYLPGNRDGNWFSPVWEYAYTHPWFDDCSTSRIGVWEEEGRIVAVVTYEFWLGEAFCHVHPNFEDLKPEMLNHAEAHLSKEDGTLHVFVCDFDSAFEATVSSRGYERHADCDRPMSEFVIPDPFPPIPLVEGFRLTTLAEENDLEKVGRVLHRGFDHPGELPPGGVEEQRRMQSGPNFRPELTMVAVGQDGEFVSYCGMWFDAVNGFAYVEPVATDPDYRRRGLGRAVVLEGIRRCGELGATAAYVGTDMPFYLSLGFRALFTVNCWRRP